MKKRGLLMLAGALLFAPTLGSCSSFMGTDPYSIEDVVISEPDENGAITITIKFTENADMEDKSFTIPKGETGNGIDNVDATYDGKTVTLTLTYTDGTSVVKTFEVIGITKIESVDEVDEETQETKRYLVIYYSDGTTSPKIEIPQGKQGDDGNGIASIDTYELLDDAGHVTNTIVTINFTDGTSQEIYFPTGARGVGIEKVSLVLNTTTGNYNLVYEDSDGNEVVAEGEIYRGVKWYSGSGNPPTYSEGDDYYTGDFYFDYTTGKIYRFDSTLDVPAFVLVLSLKDDESTSKYYTLSFNLNEPDSTKSFQYYPDFSTTSFNIKEGHCLSDFDEDLPIPYCTDGSYTFKGWYRKKFTPEAFLENTTVGAFTDMTQVYKDYNLYAAWVKNS